MIVTASNVIQYVFTVLHNATVVNKLNVSTLYLILLTSSSAKSTLKTANIPDIA